MATGPRRRADVARGSTAPLRRGAEATWQGACGPRRAKLALTRGRSHTDGPRGRPCGAPRGRRGSHVEGPRVSGPW